MAWRQPGGKPLSEPMMLRSPTHICTTRPQWVKRLAIAQGRVRKAGTMPTVIATLTHLWYTWHPRYWTSVLENDKTINLTPLRWRHNERDVVSNHQLHDYLLNRLFRPRSKKTSKFRVTGLCSGNSPGTGEFPAQMASNAENVSIWWRHHVIVTKWHHKYWSTRVKVIGCYRTTLVHCLNQSRFIVNLIPRNTFQWNFTSDRDIFIQGHIFENVVCIDSNGPIFHASRWSWSQWKFALTNESVQCQKG